MKAKLQINLPKIILSLAEIVVAILLLINPEGFTAGIIIGAGVVMVAFGAISIYKYMRLPAAPAAQQQLLAKGLFQIILGLFFMIKYSWFLAVFPLLAVLYGIGLLLTGLARVQWTVDMLRLEHPAWGMMAISAAVTVLLSIIILAHPTFLQAFLWTFVSISLMVSAVLDIVNIVMDMR